MVRSCAAWGCTNRQQKRSGVGSTRRSEDLTFHRFPLKNLSLNNQWITAIRRENFQPTQNHHICSLHFTSSDYDDTGFRRKLKNSAVPSIFAFPSHLQKPPPTPRRVIKRQPLALTRKKRGTDSLSSEPKTEIRALQLLKHDHSYSKHSKKARPQVCRESLMLQVKQLKKRLRAQQQRTRRAKKSKERLKDLLHDLKKKNLVETAAHELLEDAFGGMSLTVFRHLLRKSQVKKHSVSYCQQIKKFAVTLNYLSPKAYVYLKPTLGLPHPATLQKWRSSVQCSPGFLTQTLDTLQAMSRASGFNECSLIIDEMHLKKEVVWCPDRHMYSGHVDFGAGPLDSSVATNALGFMLVSLRSNWKAPIAYFLTDHIDSESLARTVTDALNISAERGLLVKAVVADGLKANMKEANILGCNISATNPRPFFNHPHMKFKDERVWFKCDPPHMLKLMRNLLADMGTIFARTDTGDHAISWTYIKSLHNLQCSDSLYLANKVRNQHINFKNVKMKVNIAAQTLSSSVATAIDHLREDLQLSQFRGSEETCRFIRCIDQLFDRLNAKNPYAKGFKAPLSNSNKDVWQPFFQYATSYLLSLLDISKKPLYSTPRGQAVIGFIISSASAAGLAKELIDRGSLKYLLPYKFSQDHIEMLFGKIRQRGGFNNNPTAEQFRQSLRLLLLQNDVRASQQGNTIQLDNTEDVWISSPVTVRQPTPLPTWDEELAHAAERLEAGLKFDDSDWRTSCLTYTAGFVCRRISRTLKCVDCRAALHQDHVIGNGSSCFLARKNNGGLIVPTTGIVEILKTAERAFRILMPSPCLMQTLPHTRYVDLRMQMLVINSLHGKLHQLFPSLERHFLDHEIGNEEPHSLQLLKLIVSYYLKMRLLKAGKLHHQRTILQGTTTKRMKLNKLILFSGQ